MRPIQIDQNAYVEVRLLTVELAKARYQLGRDSIMELAREAGAFVRIGKRCLINPAAIDRYVDSITGE